MNTITVERTGRIYSFSSVEFIATMPNGDKVAIWSPPWATDEEGFDLGYESPKQDEGALAFANKLWEEKSYKTLTEEYIKELEAWKAYAHKNRNNNNR